MKKRAIVVMVCAICFVASFVAAGCFGLASIGSMNRMHISQNKQRVIKTNKGEIEFPVQTMIQAEQGGALNL